MPRQVKIRVLPCSNKNEVVGKMSDGTIKIKLKAPPVKGEANKALIKFLSKEWGVAKSNIKIKRGKTSKNKLVELEC